MLKRLVVAVALLYMTAVLPSIASGQGQPDPKTMIAAQKKAMGPLAYMDGVWRGTAWTIHPSGEKHTVTQTERIGPLLDGSIKVIEGIGYDPDGQVTFNAFGIVSSDPTKQTYSMHSYAMGRSGDFVFTPTTEGFVWEIPAGPMTIRYTATVKAGQWREVGERVMEGKPPVQFFEMNLKRVGDTDWPAAGAIGPK